MRQEDPVGNVEKSSPCSSVTTLIAELPDGTDGVTPRTKCIQTKFCPEGRKQGSTRQGAMTFSSPASEMRPLKSALGSETPTFYHGSFHITASLGAA